MRSRTIVYSPRAYHTFIDRFRDFAEPVSPRGISTIELVNSTLMLRNPLDRIVTDRGRRMNIAFGFAEWYAMMFGIENLDFFQRFIHDYDRYSTDGKKADGSYGTRVQYPLLQIDSTGHVTTPRKANQLDGIIAKLKDDPCSRQAVMSIYNADDLTIGAGGKNTPCTLTLQFLIRDNELHLIVNMRSSDVYVGLTYDVFVFTMIQEYVAMRLDIAPGKYFHNAASLHAYEKDFPNFDKLTRRRWPGLMNMMPTFSDFDWELELNRLIYAIVDGEGLDADEKVWFNNINRLSTDYFKDVANCMKAFVDRERNPSLSEKTYYSLNDKTIKYALRPWLVRAKVLENREWMTS